MTFLENLNKNPVNTSIILYLIIIVIIIILKPSPIFDQNGKPKNFGIGNNQKTICPIWLICILISILCYYFILIIRTVY